MSKTSPQLLKKKKPAATPSTGARSKPSATTAKPTPRRANTVVAALRKAYPNARCSLHHENPWQLLVATVLSAQCTDKRVNLTTPALFTRYPSPAALAEADLRELEALVRPAGFFKTKAANLKATAQIVCNKFHSEVPRDLPELVSLPGVGRKTANVVRGVAYGLADGVVVDTHVARLAKRLGWSQGRTPVLIEQDLMKLLKRDDWIDVSHLLIEHGRAICQARRPRCEECFLSRLCPKRI